MHDKELPSYVLETTQPRRRLSRGLRVVLAVALSFVAFQYLRLYSAILTTSGSVQVPLRAPEWLDKCQLLNAKPGPPVDFNTRSHSDRFVPGTVTTLITVSMRSSLRYLRFCSQRLTHFPVRMRRSGRAALTAWTSSRATFSSIEGSSSVSGSSKSLFSANTPI